jgi:hypothetical protein
LRIARIDSSDLAASTAVSISLSLAPSAPRNSSKTPCSCSFAVTRRSRARLRRAQSALAPGACATPRADRGAVTQEGIGRAIFLLLPCSHGLASGSEPGDRRVGDNPCASTCAPLRRRSEASDVRGGSSCAAAGHRRLSQHPELHRSLLVSRSVGYLVRMAAGETVNCLVRGVHGHIQLFSLHSRGDDGLCAHLAVARVSCTQLPVWIPRSPASSGDTSTKVHGVFSRMPSVRYVMLPSWKCSRRRPLFRCRSYSAFC